MSVLRFLRIIVADLCLRASKLMPTFFLTASVFKILINTKSFSVTIIWPVTYILPNAKG